MVKKHFGTLEGRDKAGGDVTAERCSTSARRSRRATEQLQNLEWPLFHHQVVEKSCLPVNLNVLLAALEARLTCPTGEKHRLDIDLVLLALVVMRTPRSGIAQSLLSQ